jgi:hypothetical protein
MFPANHSINLNMLKLSPGCLSSLVKYMYTQELDVNAKNVNRLLTAATSLGMDSAKAEIMKYDFPAADDEKEACETLTTSGTDAEAEVVEDLEMGEVKEEEIAEKQGDSSEEKEESGGEKNADHDDAENEALDELFTDPQDKSNDDSDWPKSECEDKVRPKRKVRKSYAGRRKSEKYAEFHAMKGEDGWYHCDFEGCGYKSKPLCNLVRHYTMHSEKKSYSCSFCGKSFKTLVYVQDHERTHSGMLWFLQLLSKLSIFFTFQMRDLSFVPSVELPSNPVNICKGTRRPTCLTEVCYRREFISACQSNCGICRGIYLRVVRRQDFPN